MRKTKWDKIISAIIFFVSIVWFIIQKLTEFFSNLGLNEINEIIPFIAVFSIFCMAWSFIWDRKLDYLYSQVESFESKYLDNFMKEKNLLKELLVAELSKPELTESRLLYDFEMNLDHSLSLRRNRGDYAQIYVVTNDVDVENDKFGKAICKNIIDDHQYVYLTPLEDEVFIEKLRETLFRVIPNDINKFLFETAIYKNIRHIQNIDFFKILPDYSDMVIYQQKQPAQLSSRPGNLHGFYSFQNGPINNHDVDSYFYNTMTNGLATKIVEYIDGLLKENKKANLSSTNYITEKAEIRVCESDMGRGLFCKETIEAGELIMKKGGRFILKKDLDQELFSNVKYIQISMEHVVSSRTYSEDTELGFPINHDCKRPNCCINSAIEIVATKRINKGEEIFIDYAYFDPFYFKFTCKGCENCDRVNLSGDEIINNLKNNNVDNKISPYLRNSIGGKL